MIKRESKRGREEERERERERKRPRSARAGRVWGKRRGMRGRTETGRTGRQSEQAHWNPGKRRTVWYVWYGMVRYPYDSTCTECWEQAKVTIGPTIPRRPFSVHIQALHEVTWTRIPCRQGCGKDCQLGRTLNMGNRLGCSSPTAIPASPRGTSTSGTYFVYTTAKCIGIPRPATPRAGCRCSAPSTLIGPKPRPWPDPAISPFLPYRTVIGRRFPEHWHYYFFLPPILILHMLVEIPGLNPYDLALCLCCVSVNCVLC